MEKIIEVFCFLLLATPTWFEVENDRHGDFNKIMDVFVRIILILFAAGVNYYFRYQWWQPVVMGAAIFFLTFDYWIAYVLGHKKDWYSYLGKRKGNYNWFDGLRLWMWLGWKWRMVVKIVVFIVASYFYWYA